MWRGPFLGAASLHYSLDTCIVVSLRLHRSKLKEQSCAHVCCCWWWWWFAYLAVQQLVEGVVQVDVPSAAGHHKVTLSGSEARQGKKERMLVVLHRWWCALSLTQGTMQQHGE